MCNSVDASDWNIMTPFEKCCWHWMYVNETISRDLAALPANSWIRVRVEDLSSETARIGDHLDVAIPNGRVPHENRTDSRLVARVPWDNNEREIFHRWCGELMDRLYP